MGRRWPGYGRHQVSRPAPCARNRFRAGHSAGDQPTRRPAPVAWHGDAWRAAPGAPRRAPGGGRGGPGARRAARAARRPRRGRPPLDGAAGAAFTFAGGADRSVAKDLRPALDRWDRLRRASDANADAAAEAATANRLEGLGARLRADILASDRLRAVTQLGDAITTYTGTTPPAAAVTAYRAAVDRYERARNATLRKPVAFVFGYDERPVLVIVS